jgi:DNA-binding CsgD family transcriptional regulator
VHHHSPSSGAPGRQAATAPLPVLSKREREIAIAIGRGHTTTQVGLQLGISVRTVESHLLNAYRKLGIHNRVDLVRWLLHLGVDLQP